jgi:hypothetical protein
MVQKNDLVLECEWQELECDNRGSMGCCLKGLSGNDYCPGEDTQEHEKEIDESHE